MMVLVTRLITLPAFLSRIVVHGVEIPAHMRSSLPIHPVLQFARRLVEFISIERSVAGAHDGLSDVIITVIDVAVVDLFVGVCPMHDPACLGIPNHGGIAHHHLSVC